MAYVQVPSPRRWRNYYSLGCADSLRLRGKSINRSKPTLRRFQYISCCCANFPFLHATYLCASVTRMMQLYGTTGIHLF